MSVIPKTSILFISISIQKVNKKVNNSKITYTIYELNNRYIENEESLSCAREELSIAFQHEVDHLNGILFYDRIDKNKKFYTESEMRLI